MLIGLLNEEHFCGNLFEVMILHLQYSSLHKWQEVNSNEFELLCEIVLQSRKREVRLADYSKQREQPG